MTASDHSSRVAGPRRAEFGAYPLFVGEPDGRCRWPGTWRPRGALEGCGAARLGDGQAAGVGLRGGGGEQQRPAVALGAGREARVQDVLQGGAGVEESLGAAGGRRDAGYCAAINTDATA